MKDPLALHDPTRRYLLANVEYHHKDLLDIFKGWPSVEVIITPSEIVWREDFMKWTGETVASGTYPFMPENKQVKFPSEPRNNNTNKKL